MTEPSFRLHDAARLSPDKQKEWPTVGHLVGTVEYVNSEARMVVIYWPRLGTHMNLSFDDAEAVNAG